MADNVNITQGAGTIVAADDIGGGVLAQRVKIVWGVDGTGLDASGSNPFPVTVSNASIPVTGTFWQATQPVSNAGTFAVQAAQSGTWNIGSITTLPALPAGSNVIGGVTQSGTWNLTNISGTISLPTGAATAANQSTANTTLASMLTVLQDTTTPSPVKIDHTGTNDQVAVGNSPAGNTQKAYTGTFVVAGSTLTRPANVTAYSANDSISDNATPASVTAKSTNNLSDTNDHPVDIAEILLDTTDTGVGGVQIRLHLFNSDPTLSSGVVGGDNAAWSNKKAGWIGSFSGTMRAFSDGARGVLIADEGTLRLISPATGAKNLWYQLQALGNFTPSANSTTFTPTFKGFQARAA